MSRSTFGWDLPPGCTNRHIEEAFGCDMVSDLQDAVLALLEKAKLPQATCDAVIEMIREAELEMLEPDPDDQRDAQMDREMGRE